MYRSNHFESQNDVSGSSSLETSIHKQQGVPINHQSVVPDHSFAHGSEYTQSSREPQIPPPHGNLAYDNLARNNQNSISAYDGRHYTDQGAAVQRQNSASAIATRSLSPQYPPAPNSDQSHSPVFHSSLSNASYSNDRSELPALPHSSALAHVGKPSGEQGFADYRADAFEDNEVDTQISALFNAMGRASKLSQSQLATRLQTTVNVIQALEAGRLGILPDWEDIAPVVVRYAKYMNIDERPILRRLREQLTEHFLQRMTREKQQSAYHSQGMNQISNRTSDQHGVSLDRQNEKLPNGAVTHGLLTNGVLTNGVLTNGVLAKRAEDKGVNLNGNDLNNAYLRGSDLSGSALNSSTLKSSVLNSSVPKMSPLPRTDQTLKAIATDTLKPQSNNYQHGAALTAAVPAIEKRLAALVSATSQSFSPFDNDAKMASSNFAAHSQALRNEMKQPMANKTHTNSNTSYQAMPGYLARNEANGQYASGQQRDNQDRAYNNGYAHGGHGGNSPHQYNNSYTDLGEGSKKKSKWLRIVGNVVFVLILLVGFINWQPNRFWSGVDQLPKPIAKSIYSLFEFVMPDPLASVYRMNWVYVDDPRMRKSDKLTVPTVMNLPKLDFSNLGTISH